MIKLGDTPDHFSSSVGLLISQGLLLSPITEQKTLCQLWNRFYTPRKFRLSDTKRLPRDIKASFDFSHALYEFSYRAAKKTLYLFVKSIYEEELEPLQKSSDPRITHAVSTGISTILSHPFYVYRTFQIVGAQLESVEEESDDLITPEALVKPCKPWGVLEHVLYDLGSALLAPSLLGAAEFLVVIFGIVPQSLFLSEEVFWSVHDHATQGMARLLACLILSPLERMSKIIVLSDEFKFFPQVLARMYAQHNSIWRVIRSLYSGSWWTIPEYLICDIWAPLATTFVRTALDF
eukprot:gb/GECH01001839.1/.p1 GENE.gb/GECH01001839.1/~~gb/GECH01001839.1/.p1  ORF type:complete len:292 (+),score=67.98 gb/GECH01001839.1/:1-876(+)